MLLAPLLCVPFSGCGASNPPQEPLPVSLDAPAWEAPVQVADAGTGYSIGARHAAIGGPRALVVDAAGNAFVASTYTSAEPPANVEEPLNEAWGNAYRAGQGWGAPVRLVGEMDTRGDFPAGIGLTADGALFGWTTQAGAAGLRGVGVRAGWLPPGTVLTPLLSRGVIGMACDSNGTPGFAYRQDDGAWLVRYTGSLQAPELAFDTGYASAFASDGSGAWALATSTGGLGVRLPDGRWRRTALPALAGSYPTQLAVTGRPEGGFVVGWIEGTLEQLTYALTEVDAAGNVGPRTELGSVAPPYLNPTQGPLYDARPRIVVSAGGGAAVAWRARSEIFVTTARGGAWDLVQTVPNAEVAGGYPRLGAKLPFDLVLDRSGVLLIAWTKADRLVSAQRDPLRGWSPSALVAADALDPLLAMNEAGTAFAVWREGTRVMAARLLRR